MIENKIQYRRTQELRRKFQNQLLSSEGASEGSNTAMRRVLENALRSQIDEFDTEIVAYESKNNIVDESEAFKDE